jgi:hypothetical protein
MGLLGATSPSRNLKPYLYESVDTRFLGKSQPVETGVSRW